MVVFENYQQHRSFLGLMANYHKSFVFYYVLCFQHYATPELFQQLENEALRAYFNLPVCYQHIVAPELHEALSGISSAFVKSPNWLNTQIV